MKDRTMPSGAVLAAIGRVSVLWAHLEEQVAVFIWELLAATPEVYGEPRLGGAVTTVLSFRQKIQVMTALVAERYASNKAFLAQVARIRDRLEDAEAERNKIVHGIWMGLPDMPGTAFHLKWSPKRGGVGISRAVIAQEELGTLGDRVRKIAEELQSLRGRGRLLRGAL